MRPTPVAPNGLPLANFGDRFLAFLVDSLILGAVIMVVYIPLFIWLLVSSLPDLTNVQNSEGDTPVLPNMSGFFMRIFIISLVVFVVAMVSGYIYLVEMSWKTGQTVGKRAMKIQIVPVDPAGQRTRGMFAKRWAVERVVFAIVPGVAYLDGLWQLWDKPYQQCLHDKAARTVVVKVG